MIELIVEELQNDLQRSSWMDDKTKRRALNKVKI